MKLRLTGTIGSGKTNHKIDVKLVQALLNVNLRQEYGIELNISGKCDDDTIAAISDFQQYVVKMAKPDGWVGLNGGTFRELRAILKTALNIPSGVIKPAKGLVTFNAEGKEGGLHHSRSLHAAGSGSGVTLGRSYDVKEKSVGKIIRELSRVGVSVINAQKISKGHGLKGERARQFIVDNDLLDFSITPLQQKELFLISYAEIFADAKRVSRDAINVKKYGVVDWGKLDKRIKNIVVDVRYRGDYIPASRKVIQQSIVDNDFKAFKKSMKKKTFWVGTLGVPEVRFNERVAFLNKIR